MEQKKLKKLKEDLVREKEEIESELERFTTKSPVMKNDYRAVFPKSDQSDTLDEQAHNVTEYGQDIEVEQNLELRLREINETLEKINSGAYGVCNRCQSPIEENRLEAMPVAKLCVDCAKKAKITG